MKRYYTYCQYIGNHRYIGKGSGKRFLDTKSHAMCNKLYRDVFQKYGLRYSVILEYFDTEDTAYNAEIELIAIQRALGYKLLNDPKTVGGQKPPSAKGRKISQATKNKMVATRRKNGSYIFSEDHKKKISAAQVGRKTKPRSAEFRAKLSKIHKGKIISEQQRLQISMALTGRKQTLETIEKRKLTQLGKNSFLGKKHTAESKKKMSEKARGRIPWNKGKRLK